MENSTCYYDILDVDRQANPATIKKQYRKLAVKWHPDKNQSPEAEDKFKRISEAYSVLSDPEKRKQYDMFGKVGAGGGIPFSDAQGVFNMFFGGGQSFNQPFNQSFGRSNIPGGSTFFFSTGMPGMHQGGSFPFNVEHLFANSRNARTFQQNNTRRPSRREYHHEPDELIGIIKPDAQAIIKGLKSKPAYNKVKVTIEEYNPKTQRYTVRYTDTLSRVKRMALKRCNLQQLLPVKVIKNDRIILKGHLVGYYKEKDRYVIKTSDGKVLSVAMETVVIPENTSVLIRNLRTNTVLNGKYGTVIRKEGDRYLIAIDRGQLVRLRAYNILV